MDTAIIDCSVSQINFIWTVDVAGMYADGEKTLTRT